MRSLFTIYLCFGILISAFSQNTLHFSIFFDHDRSEISPVAAQTLDQVVQSLATAADFEVSLNAYTDNTGSGAYNQALAQARAEMVQAYLGIFTEKITVSSWGESRQQFDNKTEEGRQQNRRVDLELTIWSINSPEDFEARLRSKPDQVYSMVNSIEQTIQTPAGTIVVIPPGSFVFEDGTEPKEKIDITIREALTPADWIINGLATTSNGELLQSGGMMYINASAGGRELQLAEGAEITVALPALKGVDKEMQLFYGQHDQNNNTVSNWQQAGNNRRFRQTLKNPVSYLTASPELCAQLRQIKIDIPEMPAPLNFEPMRYPVMPEAPYQPKLRPAPEWSKFAKNYSSDGKLKGKKLKKAQQEFARQKERFEQDSLKYVDALQTYNTRYTEYQTKLANYEKEKVLSSLEEKRRLEAARKYMEDERLHQYTKALSDVLNKAGIKKPFRYNYTLNEAVKSRVENLLSYKYFSAKYYGAWNPDAPVYRSVFGANVIKNNQNLRKTISSGGRNCGNWRYIDSSYIKFTNILATSGLKALSDSMYTIDLEKIALSSDGVHQQSALASYVTEITQLGWINVDRFSKDPNPRIALSFEAPEAFAMYAYLPDLNSLLMLTKNEDTGVFTVDGVPKGQRIRLMTLKTENGQLWVNQQQITAGKTKDPVFNYKSYTMQAFRKELGQLN